MCSQAVAQPLESFPLTLVLCLSMHIGTSQATLHLHFFLSFLHVARVEHQALALVPPPRPPRTHSSSPHAQSTAESLLTKNNIPAPQGEEQIDSSQSPQPEPPPHWPGTHIDTEWT